MADQLDIQIAQVRSMLQDKLRIKGRDLRTQVRKAGRLLPRSVRRDAQFLIDADAVHKNPKLARMVDENRTAKAYRNVMAHLETIDARARMWTAILNVTASISLALIVLFVVVLYVLVQRGYV